MVPNHLAGGVDAVLEIYLYITITVVTMSMSATLNSSQVTALRSLSRWCKSCTQQVYGLRDSLCELSSSHFQTILPHTA